MPSTSSNIVDEVISSFSANKDWPNNAVLYRSLEDQELLPDIAKSLTVEAFLAVHGLQDQYTVCRRINAEYMAPRKGNLPFLRMGDEVVGEEQFLEFLHKKEYVLNVDLNAEKELLIRGVISMVETTLFPIELYMVWVEPDNVIETFQRYGHQQPKPLRQVLCWKKQSDVKKYLKTTGWLNKSVAEIVRILRKVFKSLLEKLDNYKYLTGELISDADIYVFGHIQAILESKMPNNVLLDTLEEFPRLANFCLNFGQVHLGNQSMLWEMV